MPIPNLIADYLPSGIHDCNLFELKSSFGTNNRRNELIKKLKYYIRKIQEVGISGWLIINGSFVTSKENPNDIDAILVITGQYPFWVQ